MRWRPGRVANAEIELYPILSTATQWMYLCLPIAIRELCIPEPYPWFHSAQNQTLGPVETRVHAALAKPATLAVLGAIFQAFSHLCPCELRRLRGEMQAMSCGASSNTQPIPVSTSQPPPAGICSVPKNNTGICLPVYAKTVLTSGHI